MLLIFSLKPEKAETEHLVFEEKNLSPKADLTAVTVAGEAMFSL